MKRLFCTAVLVLLAVSGCNAVETEQTIDFQITSDYFSRVTDRDWDLHEMTIDGVAYPLVGRTPTVQFEREGRVNGFASVNRFFGSLAIDPQGRLEWSDGFGSTKMAGAPEAMRQEDAFMKALRATERLALDGDVLTAYTLDRNTVLVFMSK